jgi:hypothetical protein
MLATGRLATPSCGRAWMQCRRAAAARRGLPDERGCHLLTTSIVRAERDKFPDQLNGRLQARGTDPSTIHGGGFRGGWRHSA